MAPGRVNHAKKHDLGSPLEHKGDIYEGLVNAANAITAANYVVDLKKLTDTIAALSAGLHWQPNIIEFHAMVTSEPVGPTDGDRYISTEAGTIPSTTQAVLVNDVCQWDAGTSLWVISTPDDGWAVVEDGVDPNKVWIFDGTNWNDFSSMLDHAGLLNLDYASSNHTGFEPTITDIDILPTAETDTAKVLKPDGGGNVSFGLPTTLNQSVNIFYVSIAKGDDSNVDGGTDDFPWATIQKVLDYCDTNGIDDIEIKLDPSVISVATVSLYAGQHVGLRGPWPDRYATSIISRIILNKAFGVQTRLFLDDMSVDIIKNGTGTGSDPYIRCEESYVNRFMDNAETGSGSFLNVYTSALEVSAQGLVDLQSIGGAWKGNVHIGGTQYFSNGINLQSKTINDVADPSSPQDADTEAARDAAIGTHTAIAAAHHAKYLDSEAVTAMGTKVDGNPLNHDKYTPTFGTGAGQECEGNDIRLSDTRNIASYRQAAEPTLGADDDIAIWVDTDDSNKTYLVFRVASGTQVKVVMT